MSVILTVMETVARFLPDAAPDPLRDAHGYIGQPFDRVDGPLKVTGAARFTADFTLEHLTFGALAPLHRTTVRQMAGHKTRGVFAPATTS